MKKLVLSFAAAAAISVGASGQEAFKHLSLGVDVSTYGVGVELALPVVSDHLVLTAGYSWFPKFTYTLTESVDEYTNELNNTIQDINSDLAITGERISSTFSPVDATITAKTGFGNGKVILEYYPWAKHSFHISAGLYFSSTDVLSANAALDDTFFAEYNSLNAEVNALKAKYPGLVDESLPESARGNIGGRTYEIDVNSRRSFDATMTFSNKVRPYVGLGWGRSIPESHFGFQFELGAWYHGKTDIVSPNQVAYDSSADELLDLGSLTLDDLSRIGFCPNISLRLIYRIF